MWPESSHSALFFLSVHIDKAPYCLRWAWPGLSLDELIMLMVITQVNPECGNRQPWVSSPLLAWGGLHLAWGASSPLLAWWPDHPCWPVYSAFQHLGWVRTCLSSDNPRAAVKEFRVLKTLTPFEWMTFIFSYYCFFLNKNLSDISLISKKWNKTK